MQSKANRKLIAGTFDYNNGKLNFTCHTLNASFDEVKEALLALRAEIDRQIINQENCPYHKGINQIKN